jgi:hypothetical protein
MPEAISNEALGRFTPLQLAGKTRCQPCGISPGFSDDCAGDAAAQPCVHAGHNNSFRGQSAGRGGVRNSLHNFWRSADLNVHHNDSPDPGNRRDCLHGGVRDIRYAGRHDDPAPKRVARQRPSTALPCQILLFSSHSPRLTCPFFRSIVSHYNGSAEHRPNHFCRLRRPLPLILTPYRSPLDVRLEASAREEAPTLCDSGPRRGRRSPLPRPRRNYTGELRHSGRARSHRRTITSAPIVGQT